jgi:hypothetical protein
MTLYEMLQILKEYEFMAGPGMGGDSPTRPDSSGVRMRGAQKNFSPLDDKLPDWPYDNDANTGTYGVPTGPRGLDRGTRPGTDVSGGPPTPSSTYAATWDQGEEEVEESMGAPMQTGRVAPMDGPSMNMGRNAKPVNQDDEDPGFDNQPQDMKLGPDNMWGGGSTIPGQSRGWANSPNMGNQKDVWSIPEMSVPGEPGMTYNNFYEWWKEVQDYAKLRGGVSPEMKHSSRQAFDQKTSPYEFVDQNTKGEQSFEDPFMDMGECGIPVDDHGFTPYPPPVEAPANPLQAYQKDMTDEELEGDLNRIWGQEDNHDFEDGKEPDDDSEEIESDDEGGPAALINIDGEEAGELDFDIPDQTTEPETIMQMPNLGHAGDFMMSPDRMGAARGTYGMHTDDKKPDDVVSKSSAWDVLQKALTGNNQIVAELEEGDVIQFPKGRSSPPSDGNPSGEPAPVIPHPTHARKMLSRAEDESVKGIVAAFKKDPLVVEATKAYLELQAARKFPAFGEAEWSLGVIRRVHPDPTGKRDVEKITPGKPCIYTPTGKRDKAVWFYTDGQSSIWAMDERDIVKIS